MTVRTRAQKYANDVTDAAKEDLQDAGKIVAQASASKAWLYPLYGAIYLIKTPRLYASARGTFVSLLGVGCMFSILAIAVVTLGLFATVYLPQALFLSIFSGPFAFVSATSLVLSEAGTISMFVARLFYLENALDDMFDFVLLDKGHETLAARGHQIKGRGAVKSLGRSLIRPAFRFSPRSMARYIITLPLQFIPVVGTAVWLLTNGYFSGPQYHYRYFQLKKSSNKEKNAFISRHRGAYTAFGTMALALSLVPVLGVVSMLSTLVGSALLAADFESRDLLDQMGNDASEKRIKEL